MEKDINYYKKLLIKCRQYPTQFMQHAEGWIIAKIDRLRNGETHD